VWIDEQVMPVPKNVYGATKLAAEHLCREVARNDGLPVTILRTSRFFPEDDDSATARSSFSRDNLQALELLYRRADLADMASAHLLAIERAAEVGIGPFIVSATTPFTEVDLPALGRDAGAVVRALYPESGALFAARGWRFFTAVDRVYSNRRAREALGWRPKHDFGHVLECLAQG
ncbi:MAG: NAD(P)-dependent oxidoreductase, partial [Sphingobium sp.]|nr:NAD(P)-dependent oxidoreductase [Sphingobium sp.]